MSAIDYPRLPSDENYVNAEARDERGYVTRCTVKILPEKRETPRNHRRVQLSDGSVVNWPIDKLGSRVTKTERERFQAALEAVEESWREVCS